MCNALNFPRPSFPQERAIPLYGPFEVSPFTFHRREVDIASAVLTDRSSFFRPKSHLFGPIHFRNILDSARIRVSDSTLRFEVRAAF